MKYCFDAAYDSTRNRLYVVDMALGIHVFQVTDGNLNLMTTLRDETPLENLYRNIKICGDRAFIASGKKGLVVLDISKKTPPTTWEWKEPKEETPGYGVFINDHYAYLAVGKKEASGEEFKKPGLYIFDIYDPDSPKLIGYCATKNAWDVWVRKEHAYVADLEGGLCVVNVSSPSNPKEVTRLTWEGEEEHSCAEIVRGEDHCVYVAAGWAAELVVVDIKDPGEPKIVGQFKSGIGCGEGLSVRDKIVYLAHGSKQDKEENGLYVIDAHHPDDLCVLGKCPVDDWVEGVCSAGNYVFITSTETGVQSIDVSDPKNPRLIDRYPK